MMKEQIITVANGDSVPICDPRI